MILTIKQVSEAFSSHKFESVYAYFSDNVKWNIVGRDPLNGKESVINNCNLSAKYLKSVTTKFIHFKVITENDSVVIDSLAEYTDSETNKSLISSCDIYEFDNGELFEVTSYCFELKK